VKRELEAVAQEERRRREARMAKEEEIKEVPVAKRAPREKSVKFAEEPQVKKYEPSASIVET